MCIRDSFKHYPLSMHPNAKEAAVAAVAADRQGKFSEMHDILFENQNDLQPSNLEKYAKEIGLNMTKFRADMKDKKVRAKVDADRAEGEMAGVEATPSIYVVDRRFQFSPDMLSDYLREELDQ